MLVEFPSANSNHNLIWYFGVLLYKSSLNSPYPARIHYIHLISRNRYSAELSAEAQHCSWSTNGIEV